MIVYRNMYADLLAFSQAQSIKRIVPEKSEFSAIERNGRRYWYARWREDGSSVAKYLGAETPELLASIREAKDAADLDRECRSIVSTLKYAGFPAPAPDMCLVLKGLAESGFFRLGGVLIGSVAFPCYHLMLGKPKFGEMPPGAQNIGDAMSQSISVAFNDRLETPFGEARNSLLQAFMDGLGGRFEPILDLDNRPSSKWRNRRSGLGIDLLTPFLTPEDCRSAWLPALRAKALRAKFLDFLLHEEKPAVVLSDSGISVNVPDPVRFAIHKLAILPMRQDIGKRIKDMTQAAQLLDVLLYEDRARVFKLFDEAWCRGPRWRRHLRASVTVPRFPEKIRRELLPRMRTGKAQTGQ